MWLCLAGSGRTARQLPATMAGARQDMRTRIPSYDLSYVTRKNRSKGGNFFLVGERSFISKPSSYYIGLAAEI